MRIKPKPHMLDRSRKKRAGRTHDGPCLLPSSSLLDRVHANQGMQHCRGSHRGGHGAFRCGRSSMMGVGPSDGHSEALLIAAILLISTLTTEGSPEIWTRYRSVNSTLPLWHWDCQGGVGTYSLPPPNEAEAASWMDGIPPDCVVYSTITVGSIDGTGERMMPRYIGEQGSGVMNGLNLTMNLSTNASPRQRAKIKGAGRVSLFKVGYGYRLSIRDVEFTHGFIQGEKLGDLPDGYIKEQGAFIVANGKVELTNCVFSAGFAAETYASGVVHLMGADGYAADNSWFHASSLKPMGNVITRSGAILVSVFLRNACPPPPPRHRICLGQRYQNSHPMLRLYPLCCSLTA